MEISTTWWVITALAVVVVILCIAVVKLAKGYVRLKSEKRGGEVRRGFMTEQWLPLVDPYPWDPQNFRFLGTPIDGIQFEDDRVIFVEFKSGSSQLSTKQVKIRELVKAGRVDFREMRVRIREGVFERLEVR